MKRIFSYTLLGLLVCSISLAKGKEEKANHPVSTKTPIDKTVTKLIHSKKQGEPFLKSFRTIVALGPSAIAILGDLASDTQLKDHQRWTCIRAMGQIGDPLAAPKLLELLEDPNPLIRIGALRALGDMGSTNSISDIQKITEKDEAMVVRSEAVKVLGRFKDVSSLPTLEKAFWDERNFMKGKSLFIRRHVVVSLGKIQSRQSIPILIKALEDEDQDITNLSIRSLERISGLRFDADNQTSVNDSWKKWWQEEAKRIPTVKVPLKEGEEVNSSKEI